MRTKTKSLYITLILAISAALGISNTACSIRQVRHTFGLENTQVQTMPDAEDEDSSASGSELWAANCMRCHNMRSPSSYSDGQWEVAVHHMRVRANLTAEESEKIVGFLKSAN